VRRIIEVVRHHPQAARTVNCQSRIDQAALRKLLCPTSHFSPSPA